MKIMTEDNLIRCPHPPGNGSIQPTQKLVHVDGRRVLVEPNPIGTKIKTCPNTAIPNVPCTATLTAKTVSYSGLLHIGGKRVCLDAVTGLTNGSPPGTVLYTVANPGQALVASDT